MVDEVGGVGSIIPSYDENNDRLKGFITNLEGLVAINTYKSNKIPSAINRAQDKIKKYNPGRITLRALVEEGLNISVDYTEEASIPLSGSFEGLNLIYLGKNSTSRKTPSDVKTLEDELYKKCLEREPNSHDNPQYHIELLPNPSNQELKDIMFLIRETHKKNGELVLYYELNLENVKGIMDSSELAVARDENHKIVSLATAEKAVLPTKRGDMEMYELGGASTFKEYRRNGLSRKCFKKLINSINDADLLYSEARAGHVGANQSSVNLGLEFRGRLEKHSQIGGSREVEDDASNYEDFNVYYFPT